MPKLLVICGPTATGKTALALSLAKKFHGELLSADSRQVYRGMDIVTGKDIPLNAKLSRRARSRFAGQITNVKWDGKKIGFWETSDGVRIWLTDLVEPAESFSVSQWVSVAQRVVRLLWKEKKLPIVVGTAGFYIKTLLDGIETLNIPPSLKLRAELSGKNTEELFEMLGWLDSFRAAGMNKSDRKNPRRLVRAIEVALGRSSRPAVSKKFDADILAIGLTAPREVLCKRIDERVDERLKQGALDEVKRLLAEGVSWDKESMTGTGYRQLRLYLEGEKTLEDAVGRWKLAEHQDGKKQMTWFKRDERIKWFDITELKWQVQVEKLIDNWYTKNVKIKIQKF